MRHPVLSSSRPLFSNSQVLSCGLPQFYEDIITRLDGVREVIPMQIHVSNCRASLDVVTFRGVPKDDLELVVSGGNSIVPSQDVL